MQLKQRSRSQCKVFRFDPIKSRGAFPPYEGLRRKILSAKTFYDAFKLRPLRTNK